jgi:hypothetical protein
MGSLRISGGMIEVETKIEYIEAILGYVRPVTDIGFKDDDAFRRRMMQAELWTLKVMLDCCRTVREGCNS